MMLMLMTSDALLLKHFVAGDLPFEVKRNQALASRLKILEKSYDKNERPTIYVHYLVNSQGVSPTPAEIQAVLEIAEEYVDSGGKGNAKKNYAAAKIDSAVGSPRAPSDKRRDVKDSQLTVFRDFLRYTRDRMKMLPANQGVERPMTEVGYATKPTDRLKQHRSHSSSNYLMNLVEAIFISRGTKYKMQHYVVFECIHIPHAMFAEILYSRLGLCYTTQGGGFSHHAAGESHGGVEKVALQYWENMQKVYKGLCFTKNIKQEICILGYKSDVMGAIVNTVELQDHAINYLNSMPKAVDEEKKAVERHLAENFAVTETDRNIQRLFDLDLDD